MKGLKKRSGAMAIAGALGFGVASVFTSAQAQLDEIIVTAQKREENIQDIPGAVSAVSEEALRLSGMTTIENLQQLVPSLSVSSVNVFGQSTIINMRGVGTSSTNAGLEAAVGFFLDGVYRSRSGLGVGDLVDVDRIEVLRGPQGTLFGKNTSAGAISVFTQNPTYELEGQGELSLGNYGAKRIRGSVNVPLAEDHFAVRMSGGFHKRDGWIDDIVTGADYNDVDRWNIRGKLLWEPTDEIEVLVIGDYASAEETTTVAVRSESSALAPVFGPLSTANGGVFIEPPNAYDLETSLNDGSTGEFTDSGVSMEVNWDFGPAKLTSISAYRNFDSSALKDGDLTAVDLFLTDFTFDQEMFTQEVRIAGNLMEPAFLNSLEWMGGLYFSKETVGSQANFPTQNDTPGILSIYAGLFGLLLAPSDFAQPPDGGGFQTRTVDGKSYSVFGHTTLGLTERLSLTGGARFNREKKIANLRDLTVAGIGNNLINFQGNFRELFDEKYTDEEVTGDVAIHFDWTDDIMTYAKFAHGFKAGGVNIDGGGAGTPSAPADPFYDSEKSNSYEIGIRTQLLNGRTTLNVTGFRTDFKDFQLQSFDGVQFILENVAGVRSEGVEVDAVISPVDGWLVSGNAAFVDADFDDGVTNGFATLGDFQLPSSPKWAGNLSSTYTYLLPSLPLSLTGHGEISFRSRTNLDSTALAPTAIQNGYSLINGRVSLQDQDDAWQVAFWCRNCGDKRYAVFAFEGFLTGMNRTMGEPRTWGVTLSGRF